MLHKVGRKVDGCSKKRGDWQKMVTILVWDWTDPIPRWESAILQGVVYVVELVMITLVGEVNDENGVCWKVAAVYMVLPSKGDDAARKQEMMEWGPSGVDYGAR